MATTVALPVFSLRRGGLRMGAAGIRPNAEGLQAGRAWHSRWPLTLELGAHETDEAEIGGWRRCKRSGARGTDSLRSVDAALTRFARGTDSLRSVDAALTRFSAGRFAAQCLTGRSGNALPSTHSTHGTTGTDSCRRCKPDGTSNVTTAHCTHTYGRFGAAVGMPPVCLWECLIARTPLGMCRGDGAHPFEEQHIRNIWRLLCARRAPRRGGAQADSLALCALRVGACEAPTHSHSHCTRQLSQR